MVRGLDAAWTMATVMWLQCLARQGSIHALWLHPRALSTGRLQPYTGGSASALASADWERLEAGYGERTRDLAAELAVHFEQGQEYHRAVHFCQ
jgi:hypothetical protein